MVPFLEPARAWLEGNSSFAHPHICDATPVASQGAASLRHVPLNSAGYSGAFYYGVGAPLWALSAYCATRAGAEFLVTAEFRCAPDRAAAIARIAECFPEITRRIRR